jgi:hypothetical protein
VKLRPLKPSTVEHALLPPRSRTSNSKVTVVKKVSGGYQVLSEKGKNLGGP